MWSWGGNSFGQLGDGTTTDRFVPTQIGTETNWKTVSAGDYHTLAVRTDGTLWAWGNNTHAQLGIGTTGGDVLNPVQVDTNTDWNTVTANLTTSYATTTDGSLVLWGEFAGTVLLYPISGGPKGWRHFPSEESSVMGLRSDGSLWAWGANDYGQLGTGGTTFEPGEVQVGSATNWAIVAAFKRSHGRRPQGRHLWAWGHNSSGQLGDGTTTDRHTPTRIGTASNWKWVAAGGDHTLAVRTDGTLWAWGSNSSGQLGERG